MTKIVVTAGHSNVDPGAVANGFKEADFCADMRNYVAFYLKNWGFTVETDGEGRTNAPLAQAISIAKGAKVAVEFHLNAAVSRKASGIEVLAPSNKKKLAQAIAKSIAKVTGSNLRGDEGFKPEDSGQHRRLGFVRAGGMIVELEFISNPTKFNILRETRWLVAKAIAETIRNYIIEQE